MIDYSSPRDAYIHTGPIPPPTMYPVGEIRHEDGTTQLIPQPVRWEATQVDDNTTVLRPLPRVDDLDGGLSWTGVMGAISEAPQSHRDPRSGVPRVPVWSLASIVSGAVLMALGWLLNDPVSRMLWEVIPR